MGGILLSFFKDIYDIRKNKKPKVEYIFPFSFLFLGLIGVGFAYYSGTQDYDEKKEIAIAKPIFTLSQISPTEFHFFLIDTFKYTLRDLNVTIRDEVEFNKFKDSLTKISKDSATYEQNLLSAELDGRAYYRTVYTVNYLVPNETYNLRTLIIDSTTNYLHFIIEIIWQGGDLTYYIEAFKSNSGWKEKAKKYDRKTGITTFE
jgi:hypothetical protein